LADTGADDTIFPLGTAQTLGIVLLPVTAVTTVIRWHGVNYPSRYGQVWLELNDGNSIWSWPALIAFSAAQIRYPILGQTGCLEYMNANFKGEDKQLLLETTPSYPGTVS
jgi:hypothetical protein